MTPRDQSRVGQRANFKLKFQGSPRLLTSPKLAKNVQKIRWNVRITSSAKRICELLISMHLAKTYLGKNSTWLFNHTLTPSHLPDIRVCWAIPMSSKKRRNCPHAIFNVTVECARAIKKHMVSSSRTKHKY
jgi:hypothetical protein